MWNVDRALGSFIGAAVGDALGAPIEFHSPRAREASLEMTGGGGFGWKPGETTDDTDMALCVSRMYDREGTYSQNILVWEFKQWMNSRPKDVGSWTRASMSRWDRSYIWPDSRFGFRRFDHPIIQLWQQHGSNDAGNGGVMRCWPTAIATPDRRDRLREATYICEDTHPDPRCTASCRAVVEAVVRLIRNGGDLTWVKTEAMLVSGNTEVSRVISHAAKLPWKQWTNSGYTVGTVESAFATLFQCSTFEEGMTWVVNRGNDADTVGAVAGSLLGARFGLSSIPTRWWHKLIQRDALLLTANRLLGIRSKRRRDR